MNLSIRDCDKLEQDPDLFVEDYANRVIARAKELVDMPMDRLRSWYPETTETDNELIRHCRQMKYTRGQLIEAILMSEFIED